MHKCNKWHFVVAVLLCRALHEYLDGALLKKKKASIYFLFTIFKVSRMSRSGQSCIVIGVVSSEPPKRTWIMAGLSPVNLGPLCKKEWPIIRPAMVNMLFSSSSTETEGMRWSGSPSKILMLATQPATVVRREDMEHRVQEKRSSELLKWFDLYTMVNFYTLISQKL